MKAYLAFMFGWVLSTVSFAFIYMNLAVHQVFRQVEQWRISMAVVFSILLFLICLCVIQYFDIFIGFILRLVKRVLREYLANPNKPISLIEKNKRSENDQNIHRTKSL